MIKALKRIIVLASMLVLTSVFAFAQAESNTFLSTFGEIRTNVDDFFCTTEWKGMEFNNIFAFTRLGANIQAGKVDAGAAFKVPGPDLYLAAYFNGSVLPQNDGNSKIGEATLQLVNITDPANPKHSSEKVTVYDRRKSNPEALYGVLAGVGGMGFKFTFEDKLAIRNAPPAFAAANHHEYWIGSLTPALQVGGTFGPLSNAKFGLSIPIAYDRTMTQAFSKTAHTNPEHQSDVVTYTTYSADPGSRYNFLKDDGGNYVQPDIYLKMVFGSFIIENNLRFRIYGTPGTAINGKAGDLNGVGNVSTVYNKAPDSTPNGGPGISTRVAFWDKRGYFQDELNPQYNISGKSGKVSYSATLGLPITITNISHSLNYTWETSQSDPLIDKDLKLEDFYKGNTFELGIGTTLNAGVQFKPLDFFSLQSGVGLDIFSWSAKTISTKKPAEAGDDKMKAAKGEAYGSTAALPSHNTPNDYEKILEYSTDTSETVFNFYYPTLKFAAGFTFSFKQNASLDFVFIKEIVPSVAGMIYKAVGDGLGDDATSLVLTIKF